MATYQATNKRDNESHLFVVEDENKEVKARKWVADNLDVSKRWTLRPVTISIDSTKPPQTLQLYRIFFQYGEHEMENEIFVHGNNPRPSTTDARQYLLKMYGNDYMEQPELLNVNGVYDLETLFDKEGNPYSVTVKK